MKALKAGGYSNPPELATSIFDIINEACSIKEVCDKKLFTPERVANFLKKSNKAKKAMDRMLCGHTKSWLVYWLNNTLLDPPRVPVVIRDTMRHVEQPQSCLKQAQKSPISPGEGPKSSYVQLVCHPEEKAGDIEEKAIDIGQNARRSVTCPDVGALKAPKRRFNEIIDLTGISNFDLGRGLKAPRLCLPDIKQKPVPQMQMPDFIPFYGPPLASQPGPAKCPVKPTAPGCKITWASKIRSKTLARSVMLTLKRFLLSTVDRLRTLYGRNAIKQGSLIKRMCLTSRLSRRPENQSHRSYQVWHLKPTLTFSFLFVSPPTWRRFLGSIRSYGISCELSLKLSEGFLGSLIAMNNDGILNE